MLMFIGVTEELEGLSDFVRRVRVAQRMSVADVSAQAARYGHKIASSYISHIENNYIESPSPKKLKALAAGLGISEDELFNVARGKPSFSVIDGGVDTEVAQDLKRMEHMFLNIPRECQLDVLASLTGIYQRRSQSMTIHERHQARASSRNQIEQIPSAQKGGKRPPDTITIPLHTASPRRKKKDRKTGNQ